MGRHTHITELLPNGASLVEARELARHSDIRMTMRYTHIGLDDQARAVAAIPTHRSPRPPLPYQNPWECPGSGQVTPIGVTPAGRTGRADHRLAAALGRSSAGDAGNGAVGGTFLLPRSNSADVNAQSVKLQRINEAYPSGSCCGGDARATFADTWYRIWPVSVSLLVGLTESY